MAMVTGAIFVAYSVLILATILFDPKKKNAIERKKRTIYFTLAFSTAKMSLAIGIVIGAALIARYPLSALFALTGLRFTWHAVLSGLISALGFFLIYVVWHMLSTRISSPRSNETKQSHDLIESLPSRLPVLIFVFGLISLEAGVLEEVFFRAVAQTHFISFIGSIGAAIAAGLIFGIAHFYQGPGGIAGTSVLGIWLGLSYAVTGNILVPIIGHVFGDFICMLMQCPGIIRLKQADHS